MSNSIVLKENSTFGEFKLLKRLGRGGMAEVYLAQAEGAGGFQRSLALKVIHPQLSHDQEFVQMLIDEAKLSAQLNHPNIVHIHNLGQVQGIYYIAMEFIDGCDVYQALVKSESRDEVFPVDVAAWIAHEACAGLYYAHSRIGSDGHPLNIIHRDISPQNIQLSREGEVKIVDFGIAKAEQRTSHTQQGVIKGKYSYMSPEQAWGDNIDQRSDIFSLGICLYEMLAGEVLYDAEDGLGLLEQVRLAQIPNLRAIRPEVAPEFEQIVYRALAAEPAQRFQSAEEMRVALASYLFRSGVTSGRQRLTQFLGELLKTPEPPEVSLSVDDAGPTRALSASDFQSLYASSFDDPSQMMSAMPSDQERTRALSAEAFAQLQSPQLAPESTADDQMFTDQDRTRAISAQVSSQLNHAFTQTPVINRSEVWSNQTQVAFDSEGQTRAIDSAQFQKMSQGGQLQGTAPAIAHAPALISPVHNFSIEEKTRAIDAHSLQGAQPGLRQTFSNHLAPTPSASAMPQASLSEVSLKNTTLPLSPPVKSAPSTPHLNTAAGAPAISSNVPAPPIPFTAYDNEERTRAVDLNAVASGAPQPNSSYMKQVLRDTFSIPKLSESALESPEPPTSPNPTPHKADPPSAAHDLLSPTQQELDHLTDSFPSPQPREEVVASNSAPILSESSASVAPQRSAEEEAHADLAMSDSESASRSPKRSRKNGKSTSEPKPAQHKVRRPKGRGRRKSLARFVLVTGAIVLVVVGGISVIPKLLAPPIPDDYKLSVSSPNASRARIYLDGQDTGQRTPALLQGLKPDVEYLVKLSAPGYEAQERRVQVKGAELIERSEQSLRVFLKRARGSIKIVSNPSGASVTMGDRYLGQTPIKRRNIKRSEEDIRITFTHPKCRPLSRIFSWGDEVESEVKVSLKCSR